MHRIWWLILFITFSSSTCFGLPIVHLQERSYAVCCNLVCLDTSCCYEGEGRTDQFSMRPVMRVKEELTSSRYVLLWGWRKNCSSRYVLLWGWRKNWPFLDTSCYEGEGRTDHFSIRPVMRVREELQFFLHPHNNRTYRDIRNCNIQHKNAPEDGLLKSETCWATECYE